MELAHPLQDSRLESFDVGSSGATTGKITFTEYVLFLTFPMSEVVSPRICSSRKHILEATFGSDAKLQCGRRGFFWHFSQRARRCFPQCRFSVAEATQAYVYDYFLKMYQGSESESL